MRSKRMTLAAVTTTLAMVVLACTESPEVAEPSTTSTTQAPSTTTATPSTTTTAAVHDWDTIENVAIGLMAATGSRDLASATALLDESVVFDWGPNGDRDGIAAAWAWEDAFTITHTLETCEARRSGDDPIARCWLRVDSKVADAAGNEPGLVCIDVTVENDLVTRVVGRDPQPGCPYNYGKNMLDPFATWLSTAHPDIAFSAMYGDRVSADGIELWRTYTAEYLEDHNS